MINILEELSRILVAVGISSSQEEQILTAVKSLSTSVEVIKEPDFHEEPKASTYDLFQSIEETKDSWTISTGEKSLEPKIEEFLPCLSTNPFCIIHSNLRGITKEKFNNGINEEVDEEHHSYIESWLTKIIKAHHSFLLQILVSHHSQQLVFHALMHCKIFISNLSMNVCVSLLCTWFHLKHSYTWRISLFISSSRVGWL